jgi:hypothetical protein
VENKFLTNLNNQKIIEKIIEISNKKISMKIKNK